MIDIDVVNTKIKELESRETTLSVCERLASLYTVRDEYYKGKPKEPFIDEEVMPYVNTKPRPTFNLDIKHTNFIEMIVNPDEEILDILNEHMERLKIICPKEYDRVIDELRKKVK